ncbi:PH domain-containing protein [Bacillus subtilis]|uniref:Membrane-flanked domain-containing protein n=1 Tax=Bacillus subtilis TaxID=1423 RepID=A0A0D1K8Q5_BACIU|nr:PH domain-containing protein [Bacillus subtilis]KIU04510.1 membrane-flanked domain-containing protein [Bacillus subtilis]MDK7656879.1 PH domain-containing protein [Bacillus subtilis]MDQ4711689.1 PH domain-containing protein [Bacillus subtilis]MEC0398285.1 PH domain-containing protein [Bacillus subtilis]MEC0436168.1 PH domain-containing protein [Bacillus subtilis]
MNKRRDNFIEFIYHTYSTVKNLFLPLLALAVSLIGEKNHYTPYVKLGFYILIGFIITFSFLKWYNKTYEIDQASIRITQGVFAKRFKDVPINRVKSITASDSLLKRVFNISNISLELIGGDEIRFVLSNKDVANIRRDIFKSIKIETPNKRANQFGFKEYFLMSFTNIGAFLGACSLSFTFLSFALHQYLKFIGEDTDDRSGIESINSLSTLIEDPSIVSMLVLIAVSMVLAVAIIAYILMYPLLFFTYSNFHLGSNDKSIHVEYGILNKKSYHIPKQQIRSLRIIEPMVLRWFGYAQIKVDNIGFRENRTAAIMVCPIIRKDKVDSLLESHLQQFQSQPLCYRPIKSSIINYMLCRTFKLKYILTVIILSFLSFYALYLTVLIPVFLFLGFLKWKYSALNFNSDYLTIRYVNGLSTVTLITHKKYVETTTTEQTFLMKGKQSSHYKVALYSERLEEVYGIRHLPDRMGGLFLKYVR